jgi:hypothetical protein
VNGRNAITWEAKLQYDLEYIKRITFFRDLSLILKTVIKTVRRDGISQEGMDTALDFGDYLVGKNLITKSEYEKIVSEAPERLWN